MKKDYRRRRIADNLVPCYCAASVMYSRTLPQLLIRKTRPCLALHPPMEISRFAYLAALVVYKSTLPQLLIRKTLFLPRTASADGNGAFCLPRRFGRVQKYTPCAARAQSYFFCFALHPSSVAEAMGDKPREIDRFAYLASSVVYKKYTPSAARAQNQTLPHTASFEGNEPNR